MGRIATQTFIEPGDTIAATVADVFDDLATESQTINDQNTASEWCSTSHFDWAADPVVKWCDYNGEDIGVQNIASATFAAVAVGANNCELVMNITPEQGDVLRVHFTALISEVDPVTATADDYYFRIRATIGGVDTTILDQRGWSMRAENNGYGGAGENIENQRCSLSMCYIFTDANPGALTKVWAETRVRDATNDFDIERFSITGILFGA
jgi:hypothetical protein